MTERAVHGPRTTISEYLASALARIDEADEELEVELFTTKPDPNGPLTPDERARLALWNAVEDIKAAQRLAESAQPALQHKSDAR